MFQGCKLNVLTPKIQCSYKHQEEVFSQQSYHIFEHLSESIKQNVGFEKLLYISHYFKIFTIEERGDEPYITCLPCAEQCAHVYLYMFVSMCAYILIHMNTQQKPIQYNVFNPHI